MIAGRLSWVSADQAGSSALCLTDIFVSRVLRQLREQDLLTLEKGIARIHDLKGLRKLAGYQGGYLNSRN